VVVIVVVIVIVIVDVIVAAEGAEAAPAAVHPVERSVGPGRVPAAFAEVSVEGPSAAASPGAAAGQGKEGHSDPLAAAVVAAAVPAMDGGSGVLGAVEAWERRRVGA
jgi:hypothetical protein